MCLVNITRLIILSMADMVTNIICNQIRCFQCMDWRERTDVPNMFYVYSWYCVLTDVVPMYDNVTWEKDNNIHTLHNCLCIHVTFYEPERLPFCWLYISYHNIIYTEMADVTPVTFFLLIHWITNKWHKREEIAPNSLVNFRNPCRHRLDKLGTCI